MLRRHPREKKISEAVATRNMASCALKEARRQPALPVWLKREVGKSLSFEEMRVLLEGRAGLYLYNEAFDPKINLRAELAKWADRALVFLYRSRPEYGHYMCVFERPDSEDIYVFDSYGRAPDAYGAHLSADVRVRLQQTMPLLLEAVLAAHYRAIQWNEYKLQAIDPKVTTCGRWCVIRIALRDLGVKAFAQAVRAAAKSIGGTPDQLVTLLTQDPRPHRFKTVDELEAERRALISPSMPNPPLPPQYRDAPLLFKS
jgi:hypothetical protein